MRTAFGSYIIRWKTWLKLCRFCQLYFWRWYINEVWLNGFWTANEDRTLNLFALSVEEGEARYQKYEIEDRLFCYDDIEVQPTDDEIRRLVKLERWLYKITQRRKDEEAMMARIT